MLVLRRPVPYSFARLPGLVVRGGFVVCCKFARAVWPLFLVLMLMAVGSTAATTTYFKVGDDLKASCEGSAAGEANADTAEYLLCLGYLQAVVDTDATFAEWGNIRRQACIPQGVTSSELRQVFLDWIHAREDQLHFSAASLAITAFSEKWVCE